MRIRESWSVEQEIELEEDDSESNRRKLLMVSDSGATFRRFLASASSNSTDQCVAKVSLGHLYIFHRLSLLLLLLKFTKKKKCSSSQYMYILYIRKIKQNKYETKCFIFHGTVRLEWEHMTTCGIMFSHFYVHVNTGRPFF